MEPDGLKAQDAIYRFNPTDDSWTTLEAKLKNCKYGATAMFVDGKMFQAQ
jgi:N-acetylneuraminic acid mutarotase